MPTPTAITDLSQTASSNYPAGGDSPATLDDVQRAHASFIALLRDGKGQSTPVTLASASTTDIGAQNSTFVEISGTTTITSFGTNYTGVRFLRFAAALTLTHNGSSLILPTGANITTAANDTAIAVPAQSGSGWAVISYMKANGSALVASTNFLDTTRIDVASATTVSLTADAPSTRHINITGTTTITGFTVAAGLAYFVRFNAALTLTNNAAIITQTGANITTAAGDTCLLRATASNTVEVLAYSPAGLLPATATPQPAGTAAVGTALRYAREDHVHAIPSTITVNSSVATTSGTSVNLSTSIPSTAKRVTLLLDGVSTSGLSGYIIQGGAGSFDTSGYTSVCRTEGTSATSTAGFIFTINPSSSSAYRGALVLQSMGSNKWSLSGVVADGTAFTVTAVGVRTFGGVLDRLRITTAGGSDTFDAGSVVVTWE